MPGKLQHTNLNLKSEAVYKTVDPPHHLVGHGKPRSWSDDVAQEHFDWFVSIRKDRIGTLLTHFNVARPPKGGEHDFLLKLGNAVAECLFTEPNFKEVSGKKELTAPGLSMAHDIGIFVAELIIDSAEGEVKWTLLKEPPRALEFNLPILIGKPPRIVLDPIRGSLTEAKAILRDAESSDIWARTYEFWLKRFTNDIALPARKTEFLN